MKCSRCDFNNPDSANYCNNCGHNLKLDKQCGGKEDPPAVSNINNADNTENRSNSQLGFLGKILVAAAMLIMILMSVILIMVVLNADKRDTSAVLSIEYLVSSEKSSSKSASKSSSKNASKSSSKSKSYKSSSKTSSDNDDFDELDGYYEDEELYDYPYPEHIAR